MPHVLALPFWTVLPFAGLLLSIAILPLLTPHFWDSHRNKGLVAALFALPVALYLLLVHGAAGLHELLEKAREYTSFILLLGALFAITGGIRVRGSLSGTPLLNTALLGLGAVLANLIGTTGASRAADPAAAARERAAREQDAHRRLLHLRGVELRRPADAARRSAALPRLPEGRSVRLDAPALEAVAARERAPARDLQRLGPARLQPRGGASARARSSRR